MGLIINFTRTEKVNKILASYPLIISGYLFGSRIKGRHTSKSDLDLGLLCLSKRSLDSPAISVQLEKIVTAYALDVEILDLESDPLILIQVINGKLIYQKTLSERASLETRILHLYEDDKVLGKIRSYYLYKSFKEGIYAH